MHIMHGLGIPTTSSGVFHHLKTLRCPAGAGSGVFVGGARPQRGAPCLGGRLLGGSEEEEEKIVCQGGNAGNPEKCMGTNVRVCVWICFQVGKLGPFDAMWLQPSVRGY